MAGKTRVHELAKELGIAPKLVIDQLHGMGYKEQSSASAIEDSLLPRLRDVLGDQAAEYSRKESERLESERLAAQRAKIEAAKAAAAKAERTGRRKAAEGPKAPAGKGKAPVKAKPPLKVATPALGTAARPKAPLGKAEKAPVPAEAVAGAPAQPLVAASAASVAAPPQPVPASS